MMRRIRNWLCYHNFHSYSKWEAYPHGRITDEMGLQVPGYCELRHCYHCPLSECRMKLRDEIEVAEDVAELIAGTCHFCGSAPSNTKITKNCREGFRYNGIDRTDSLRGYDRDNVVTACDFCNRAKGNKANEEFLAWVKRINEHQNAMAKQWG